MLTRGGCPLALFYAVGGSIHVANIYERRMTLGAASTLVAPSIMRQHLKLSALDMLRVCGALL